MARSTAFENYTFFHPTFGRSPPLPILFGCSQCPLAAVNQIFLGYRGIAEADRFWNANLLFMQISRRGAIFLRMFLG